MHYHCTHYSTHTSDGGGGGANQSSQKPFLPPFHRSGPWGEHTSFDHFGYWWPLQACHGGRSFGHISFLEKLKEVIALFRCQWIWTWNTWWLPCCVSSATNEGEGNAYWMLGLWKVRERVCVCVCECMYVCVCEWQMGNFSQNSEICLSVLRVCKNMVWDFRVFLTISWHHILVYICVHMCACMCMKSSFVFSRESWQRQSGAAHTAESINLWHGWDFSGYSWISGFKYLSENNKNGFAVHFECEFSPVKIQTSTWSPPHAPTWQSFCGTPKLSFSSVLTRHPDNDERGLEGHHANRDLNPHPLTLEFNYITTQTQQLIYVCVCVSFFFLSGCPCTIHGHAWMGGKFQWIAQHSPVWIVWCTSETHALRTAVFTCARSWDQRTWIPETSPSVCQVS